MTSNGKMDSFWDLVRRSMKLRKLPNKEQLKLFLATEIYKFSEEHDDLISIILAKGTIKSVSEYDATFTLNGENVQVWITNRWYGYGTSVRVQYPHGLGSILVSDKARPSKETRWALYKVVREFAPPYKKPLTQKLEEAIKEAREVKKNVGK